MVPVRLAIAASGEGTTFEHVAANAAAGRIPIQLVMLLASRENADVVERARELGVPVEIVAPTRFESAEGWDIAVERSIQEHRIELLLLAGFLRKLGPRTLRALDGRILNTHPALLPKFGGKGMYGTAVHEAVLASGDQESGVTIHLVEEEYERGAALAPRAIAVVEEVDARFFADIPERDTLRFLRRLVNGGVLGQGSSRLQAGLRKGR